MNGDGHLDVVTASAFLSYLYPGLTVGAPGGYFVSVFQGNGQGSVSPAALYRVGSDNYALATLDLTGNGKAEIVALSQRESKGDLLVNDGSGGFGSPTGETIGYTAGAVNAPIPGSIPQVVDLNGDGKPDVLLMEYGIYTAPDQLTALINDGTGKLAPPVRTATTVAPTDPVPVFMAGVFRSGRAADMIYVQPAPSAAVTYMPGAGNGSFGTAVSLGSVTSPERIVSGDFNGDGKLDFAIYGAPGDSTTASELDVFLGDGTGAFTSFQRFPSLTRPRSLPHNSQQARWEPATHAERSGWSARGREERSKKATQRQRYKEQCGVPSDERERTCAGV